MVLPLLVPFWFVVAADVIHCLDDSLLGGSFVEKVQPHWWPEYAPKALNYGLNPDPIKFPDASHHIFEFPLPPVVVLFSPCYFHDYLRPEGEANYNDRHKHVDTNYVSSGGGSDKVKHF